MDASDLVNEPKHKINEALMSVYLLSKSSQERKKSLFTRMCNTSHCNDGMYNKCMAIIKP